MSWCSGKTVLVTGAGRGIGLEIARKFGRLGAHVVIAELSNVAAQAAAGIIRSDGGKATAQPCDVGDADAVENLVATTLAALGPIAVLVNNAGIMRARMLWNMSIDAWDEVVRTNLTGQFLTTRAVVRASMREHGGAIINVASIVGLRGTIGQVNYAAAKAGVVGLTKSSALELGRFGIRVNAVAPGLIETEMTREAFENKEMQKKYADEVVLGRFGQPDDVANAVVFLASPESSWITGKVLAIDGGAYN
jgi:3-oxoacyl-[acyl-carrier protein] reductase